MPAGPIVIEAVASVLTDKPLSAVVIRGLLPRTYALSIIRNALKQLMDAKKAKRVFVNRHRMYIAYKEEV